MIPTQDVLIKTAIAAAATINSATTTSSTGVTMPECEFVLYMAHFGAVTAIADTITSWKVQGSDDNSSWTDIDDLRASTNGTAWTPADTDDNKWLVVSIDARHRKHKYLRHSIVTTGSPNFVLNDALFIGMGNKQVPPTSNFSASQLVTHAL